MRTLVNGAQVIYRGHETHQNHGAAAGVYSVHSTDELAMCGYVEIVDALGRIFPVDASLLEPVVADVAETATEPDPAPRAGRRFAHGIHTTGYHGPDGPEPIVYEITEVGDSKVYYGPVQRGIPTQATLWIWQDEFARDALGTWID